MTDDWKKRKLTESIKRLAMTITAKEAIPDGGGISAGIGFLSDPLRFKEGVMEGFRQAFLAIDAVRSASEPNPWKDSTDEEIAAEIMRQIEERKGKQRR